MRLDAITDGFWIFQNFQHAAYARITKGSEYA